MSDSSEMREPAPAYGPPAEAAATEPWSHPWLDQLGLQYHRAIAQRITAQPALLQIAIGNIDRWLTQNDYPPAPRQALLEWRAFLASEPLERIVDRMTDPSEKGHERRQNTPFAGILTDRERKQIRERYEQATTR